MSPLSRRRGPTGGQPQPGPGQVLLLPAQQVWQRQDGVREMSGEALRGPGHHQLSPSLTRSFRYIMRDVFLISNTIIILVYHINYLSLTHFPHKRRHKSSE